MPENKRYESQYENPAFVGRATIEGLYAAATLRTFLDVFAVKFDLGSVLARSVEMKLTNADIARSDIVFVSKQRANIVAKGVVHGAPDLIVDIFTTPESKAEKAKKREIYAQHGVKEYWQVDTYAADVAVWLLGKDDYELVGRYGAGQTLLSPTLQGLGVGVGGAHTCWSASIVARQGRIRFGYDDYLRTPEGERYELFNGVLITRE